MKNLLYLFAIILSTAVYGQDNQGTTCSCNSESGSAAAKCKGECSCSSRDGACSCGCSPAREEMFIEDQESFSFHKHEIENCGNLTPKFISSSLQLKSTPIKRNSILKRTASLFRRRTQNI